MKFLNKYLYIALALFVGTACEPDLSDKLVTPDNGNDTAGALDFSNYIAVGNSLTAGYADGALYEEAQRLSYPSIIAQQVSTIGGGDFVQPIVSGAGFGVDASGLVGHLQITKVDPTNTANPVEFSRNTEVNAAAAFAKATETNINNYGVPGIRVADITLQGYGNSLTSTPAGNPYFFRLVPATDPLKTYLEVVAETSPTFFTCWLGNNDVLGYATSGGVAGVEGAGAAGAYMGGITPTALFEANYNAMIATLTQNGAEGVVVTIPNVTDIPFFTTIPVEAVRQAIVLDAGTAAALEAGYAGYNEAVRVWNENVPVALRRPKITFQEGANYPVIVDESLSDVPLPTGGFLPKYRIMTSEDLFLLTLPREQLPLGLGTQTAIPSQYTLTVAEQAHVAEAIGEYNDYIARVARNNSGIALWDANAFFSSFVTNGYKEGSLSMGSSFITGGAFSLDGVHATPRGYALVANQIISTMNEYFGVTVLPVKLQDYRTVKLQ